VNFYTSVDLPVPRRSPRRSRPGIPDHDPRGTLGRGERNFQRIGQEYASKIYVCDVVNSSDAAHLIGGSARACSRPMYLRSVAQYFRLRTRIPTACSPRWRVTMSIIAYNTKLVTKGDAPKSYADLLDPKWVGKIVKRASRLFRHHHDGHATAQPRPRLGVVREARKLRG